mmetsp:Transcript_4281/g.6342  ORF Transcript_4281/g.6342 Transcript_4281/m.6342 type:complete len:133 (-) Transcript_4281:482-880(-)
MENLQPRRALSLPIVHVFLLSLILFLTTKSWDSFRLIPILISLRILGVAFKWVLRAVQYERTQQLWQFSNWWVEKVTKEVTDTTSGSKNRRRFQAAKLAVITNPSAQNFAIDQCQNFIRHVVPSEDYNAAKS